MAGLLHLAADWECWMSILLLLRLLSPVAGWTVALLSGQRNAIHVVCTSRTCHYVELCIQQAWTGGAVVTRLGALQR
jgi:hypothetical protein